MGISRTPCEAGTKWDRWQALAQTISREKMFGKTEELRTEDMKSLSKLTGSGLVICGFPSDLIKLLLTQIKSPPSQTHRHTVEALRSLTSVSQLRQSKVTLTFLLQLRF